MSIAERRKGGGPSGTRAQSAVKRAEIIQLRLAGRTLEDVASIVDLTSEGVRYHEQAWLAAQMPSSEVTEELRQKQLAQVDAITAKLWPKLDDPDEYLAVTDRIAKLMDRKARLMGLDLTTQTITVNVTAEGLAAALGFDDVIEVEAVEQPVLEAGDA